MVKFDDVTIERLFGSEDAENENSQRFKEYFYFNRTYENLRADLPIRILVGHKGIGKSALLRRAFLENEDENQLAVWIRPNDLVPKVGESNESELNRLIENWKRGLLDSVYDKAIERLYDTSSDGFTGSISRLAFSSVVDAIKEQLRKYAPETVDAAKREILNNFKYNEKIFVYIDDIDRGWSASKESIRNISALLNAMRDLSGADDRLRFRIGLRSDVYYLVRTSDESTDKIERHVIWLTWSNHEILTVIAKRIETFFGSQRSQEEISDMSQADISKNILSKIMIPTFEGQGHWSKRPIHNVLLSLTRKRPRDLVKLMHGAARNAFLQNRDLIETTHMERTFEPYSTERLQDIINEFSSELPEIEKLLLGMRPTKKQRRASENYLYATDSLVTRVKNIIDQNSFYFANKKAVTPKSLIQFMYKIDFITARMDTGSGIDRKYFDQSRFLANEFVDFGYDWEVHPAYRWALQPQDVQQILNSIDQ